MGKLTIERSFSSPIEKVWEALTSTDKLKKWWVPSDFEASYISVDLKNGGIFGYCFKNSEGQEYWGRGVYQTIQAPKYLSWIDTFTDSKGNPVPPSYYGLSGEEIIESLVEFTLETDNDITKMTMIGENPYDESMLEDMEKSWNGMFDKLEAIVKSE